MAQPGPSAHLGHLPPAPRSPSAGAAQTTQDRPPSCPARSAGPLRGPRRRESPRSPTQRNRSPRRHPHLAYSSSQLCLTHPPLTGPALASAVPRRCLRHGLLKLRVRPRIPAATNGTGDSVAISALLEPTSGLLRSPVTKSAPAPASRTVAHRRNSPSSPRG